MTSEPISALELTTHLKQAQNLPVKIYFNETVINPGYHITEIKQAFVQSIDCGKNSAVENWEEMTIQLLDGAKISSRGSTAAHMPASKFSKIVDKARQLLSVKEATLLFFEYTPGNGPILKLHAESINTTKSECAIFLATENAACKPYERSVAANKIDFPNETQVNQGCCGTTKQAPGGCC